MTCDNALELLSAALDGELSVEEKAQLDLHLAQCDGCRALYDDLTAIHGACAGLEVTPPPALKVNILQNLPAREKPAKVIWVHWKRWAAMAAAFVLVSLAAWNLPKTGLTGGSQALPEQASITQDALTDTPTGVISAPADVSGVSNDPAVDSAMVTEGISDLESSVDSSPAPTPSPDFFNGEPVNVNAYTSTASTGGAAQKRSAVATDAEGDRGSATYTGYGETKEYALFDTDATEDAGASDEIIPMLYSARMASPSPTAAPSGQPAPANGSLDRSAYFDDEAHPEPHPEMGEDEIVPAELFKAAVTGEAATVYCGVLTIRGETRLKDYTPQEQENGELWYELPNADFHALLTELTGSAVDFDLRTAGADISSSAQTGRVIVLP